MTTAFIMDLIPVRMAELGFGDSYRTEMRSMMVQPGGPMRIEAHNVWIYFPSELVQASAPDLEVESHFGYLNLSGSHQIQEFEHTGQILLNNNNAATVMVRMIVAIPISVSHPQPD